MIRDFFGCVYSSQSYSFMDTGIKSLGKIGVMISSESRVDYVPVQISRVYNTRYIGNLILLSRFIGYGVRGGIDVMEERYVVDEIMIVVVYEKSSPRRVEEEFPADEYRPVYTVCRFRVEGRTGDYLLDNQICMNYGEIVNNSMYICGINFIKLSSRVLVYLCGLVRSGYFEDREVYRSVSPLMSMSDIDLDESIYSSITLGGLTTLSNGLTYDSLSGAVFVLYDDVNCIYDK